MSASEPAVHLNDEIVPAHTLADVAALVPSYEDLSCNALAYRDMHKGCGVRLDPDGTAVDGIVVLARCHDEGNLSQPIDYLGVYRERDGERWLEYDGVEPWGRRRFGAVTIREVLATVCQTIHPARHDPFAEECRQAFPWGWDAWIPCPADYDRAGERRPR